MQGSKGAWTPEPMGPWTCGPWLWAHGACPGPTSLGLGSEKSQTAVWRKAPANKWKGALHETLSGVLV